MNLERRLAAYLEQVRAKYSSEQLDNMLSKGEAFKNANGEPSYPIGDEEDLKNAIHAVGRAGADHDAVRKYIIGRAKALELSDLIPDNWNADGSLADEEKAATWDAQHRDSGSTYSDLYDCLSSSLCAEFEGKNDWLWLCDFSDEWAVYELNGEKFQVPYSIDGDTVKLGKSTPVRTVTSYVPVESKSARGGQMCCDGRSAADHRHDSEDGHCCTDPPGHVTPAPTEIKSSTLPAVPKRAITTLIETPPPVVLRFGYDTASELPFTGYASTVDQGYDVQDWLGEYNETIGRSAFDKTLTESRNVPLLFDHDGEPLASTQANTSVLLVDARGLRNDASLNSQRASLIEALRRGDLNKMSFSFRSIKDTWNEDYTARTVNELALYDTSIVTYPANPNTSAELRSAARAFLGREGRSLIAAARAAMPMVERRSNPATVEPVMESTLNLIGDMDRFLCSRYGRQGRARTMLVARVLVQAREGKVLSGANEDLLRRALAALHDADDALTGVDSALDEGQAAISTVLDVANPDGGPGDPDDKKSSSGATSGLDADAGGGNGNGPGGNPITPADGAGPRSAPPAVLKAQRELELFKLRRRR